MRVQHFKGIHFSLPPRYRRFKGDVVYSQTFKFTEPEYNHGDSDQADWNKLTGFKKEFLSPKVNSVMIGWRWNLDTKRVEVNFYEHIDGTEENGWGRKMGPILFSIPKGDSITVRLMKGKYFNNKMYVEVLYKGTSYVVERDWQDCYLVNSYFGGNRTAKVRLDVY